MSSLEEISTKVNEIIFYNLISQDGIVCDEGEGNVLLMNGQTCRWIYSNSNEIGNGRTEQEDQQILYLNNTMNLLIEFQNFMAIRSEAPIETIDPYTSIHSELNCGPTCSCGNWDGTMVEATEDSVNNISDEINDMKID